MRIFNRLVRTLISLTLSGTFLLPANGFAAETTVLNLPVPGSMVGISPKFVPTIVKGITIYPNDPFKFDFIVDTGDANLSGQAFKD